jgi:hypothetical protein
MVKAIANIPKLGDTGNFTAALAQAEPYLPLSG